MPTHGSEIGPDQAIELLRSLDPALDICWNELTLEWGAEELPRTLVFGDFARVACAIAHGDRARATAIFDFVEQLLNVGDPEVKDVIRTGFVEALVNNEHSPAIKPCIGLLGHESRKYAKAWREFWAKGHA